MSASDKVHRWLDLLASLLSRHYPVSLADLRRDVPGYADDSVQEESLLRTFERWEQEMHHLLAHNRGASERLEFNLPDRSLRARHPLGQQAHNLWQQDGQWHTCSSGEGRLIGDADFVLATGGFPRGIARVGAHTAVGISQLAERHQRDLTDGHIHIYNDQWQLQHQWILPGEGLVLDIKCSPSLC